MSETSRTDFGKHYLVDLLDCDPAVLDFVDTVKPRVLEAVRACGATMLAHFSHQFEPHGVSVVVMIAESHIAIHSWPEDAFVALDIFTCGETMKLQVAVDELARSFGAGRVEVEIVTRGSLGARSPGAAT